MAVLSRDIPKATRYEEHWTADKDSTTRRASGSGEAAFEFAKRKARRSMTRSSVNIAALTIAEVDANADSVPSLEAPADLITTPMTPSQDRNTMMPVHSRWEAYHW